MFKRRVSPRACYQGYTHKHQLEKQEGKLETRGKSDDETLQVEPPPGKSSSPASHHDHAQDISGMRTRSRVVKTNKDLCQKKHKPAAECKRRAQPFTSTEIGLSRPILLATVQYFIQILNVWFF